MRKKLLFLSILLTTFGFAADDSVIIHNNTEYVTDKTLTVPSGKRKLVYITDLTYDKDNVTEIVKDDRFDIIKTGEGKLTFNGTTFKNLFLIVSNKGIVELNGTKSSPVGILQGGEDSKTIFNNMTDTEDMYFVPMIVFNKLHKTKGTIEFKSDPSRLLSSNIGNQYAIYDEALKRYNDNIEISNSKVHFFTGTENIGFSLNSIKANEDSKIIVQNGELLTNYLLVSDDKKLDIDLLSNAKFTYGVLDNDDNNKRSVNISKDATFNIYRNGGTLKDASNYEILGNGTLKVGKQLAPHHTRYDAYHLSFGDNLKDFTGKVDVDVSTLTLKGKLNDEATLNVGENGTINIASDKVDNDFNTKVLGNGVLTFNDQNYSINNVLNDFEGNVVLNNTNLILKENSTINKLENKNGIITLGDNTLTIKDYTNDNGTIFLNLTNKDKLPLTIEKAKNEVKLQLSMTDSIVDQLLDLNKVKVINTPQNILISNLAELNNKLNSELKIINDNNIQYISLYDLSKIALIKGDYHKIKLSSMYNIDTITNTIDYKNLVGLQLIGGIVKGNDVFGYNAGANIFTSNTFTTSNGVDFNIIFDGKIINKDIKVAVKKDKLLNILFNSKLNIRKDIYSVSGLLGVLSSKDKAKNHNLILNTAFTLGINPVVKYTNFDLTVINEAELTYRPLLKSKDYKAITPLTYTYKLGVDVDSKNVNYLLTAKVGYNQRKVKSITEDTIYTSTPFIYDVNTQLTYKINKQNRIHINANVKNIEKSADINFGVGYMFEY